ncbi:AAA family ATPase [Lederbergia panacisoli]|uniref:AAA family ATPase n=1 Tax=Lederbergia panacisoli TaxID=1255251 RepID=UPI00214B177E|nr:AAA family ATPase [Lederbergia panacisoli]MCR2823698.1 AAA family ATPase [Lederbergia panacisoli]
MRSTNAMVVTEDESLLTDIKRILYNFEVMETNVWEGPYVQDDNIQYFLIDELMLDAVVPAHIPMSSVLIGLVRDRSFENARKWMKLGAKELVIIPNELEKLVSVLQKPFPNFAGSRSASDYYAYEGSGDVRAFYSAKGGTGKTLIAAMVAQNLQMQCDQRVILIDFNVQFGGVEVVFGIEPERSYMDLLPVINELSINHIQNVAVREENTGIHVLLSPANPEQNETATDEMITRIIRTCRNHFDQVILDLPSTFNSTTFTALNEATHIYYILNPDSLSVRGLKHTINHFHRYQIGNKNNVSVIINRNNHKAELTEKNIGTLIDLPIIGSIRADFYGIQPFINMGRPFYHKKHDKGVSKTAQDVRKMVKKLVVKGV